MFLIKTASRKKEAFDTRRTVFYCGKVKINGKTSYKTADEHGG